MIGLISLLLIVIFPVDSIAWGGGMHLQLGVSVLNNLSVLEPSLACILSTYPHDFLYGCISADITVGKKFTHYMLNCHRWQIGQSILKAAKDDRQRACGYGYLCHLAADVIAHNFYVPYKTMRSFATITMKHAYWEMRFETFVEKDVWKVAKDVCKTDQTENDRLMRSVLTPTLFSFRTNKKIFSSIMLLSRLEKWQKIMQTLSDKSRYQLAETDRDNYLRLAEETVLQFISNPAESSLLQSDPTGERALATADAIRTNLRILYRTGKITKAEGLEKVESMKEILRSSLYEPERLKELHPG